MTSNSLVASEYSAPEVSGPHGTPVDVFSLGKVLLSMWHRDAGQQGCTDIVGDAVVNSDVAGAGLSAGLRALVEDCLRPEPEQRPTGNSVGQRMLSLFFNSAGKQTATSLGKAEAEGEVSLRAPILDDFELIRVLGKGYFGKVMLVRHKGNMDVLYAMKVLRNENDIKRNQVISTKAERDVLEAVSHPFVVALYYVYRTPKNLHLVLEYCPGGHLFFHLSRAGRFPEGHARFYTAELLLALEYLHTLDIIFRDLKPENVLLDAQGHVKITDYGLSMEGVEDNYSAMTMSGTPEYLAPEILNKQSHGKAVDWYSLGALLFEMLTGRPPFYSKDRMKLFQLIRKAELEYPSHMSRIAIDCCQAMMDRSPSKRLGGGESDGGEIKQHAFFDRSDWTAYYERRVSPPFTPDLT